MQKPSESKVFPNFKTRCSFVCSFVSHGEIVSIHCGAQLVRCAYDGDFFLIISEIDILACPTYSPGCGLWEPWCSSREPCSDSEAWSAKRGTGGSSPARTVTHKEGNTDHEDVGGIITFSLLSGGTINTHLSHPTPTQLYSWEKSVRSLIMAVQWHSNSEEEHSFLIYCKHQEMQIRIWCHVWTYLIS